MSLAFNSSTGRNDPPLSGFVTERRTPPVRQPGKRAYSTRTTLGKCARALFVDFDGVLHPLVSSEIADAPAATVRTGHFGWLPALVGVLRPHPEVSIVVQSTWRYTHDADELRLLLGALGPRFAGATPRGPRYESIEGWLHLNPQFADHRILDDDPGEFPVPAPQELILCDPTTGVAAPRVLAAIRNWLEG